MIADNFGVPSTATYYLVHGWHDSINDELGISVNAGIANTTAHSAGVFDSTSNFTMGRNDESLTLYWDGLIDEAGFWKRVLTSDERTQLYNAGNGLAYPFVTGGFNPSWAWNSSKLVGCGIY